MRAWRSRAAAGYYDHAGALVDMLQSHALHVLSFWQWSRRALSARGDVRDGAAAVLRPPRCGGTTQSAVVDGARYTAGMVRWPDAVVATWTRRALIPPDAARPLRSWWWK